MTVSAGTSAAGPPTHPDVPSLTARARQLFPPAAARHTDLAPPPQQFAFAPDVTSSSAVRDGSPITAIALRFGAPSTPSWAFDSSSGRYLRSQAGVADLESPGRQQRAIRRGALVLGRHCRSRYHASRPFLEPRGGGTRLADTWRRAKVRRGRQRPPIRRAAAAAGGAGPSCG